MNYTNKTTEKEIKHVYQLGKNAYNSGLIDMPEIDKEFMKIIEMKGNIATDRLLKLHSKGWKDARIKMNKKLLSPKYKVGDMVYSWQNTDVKRRIAFINTSNDPDYEHKYRVTLNNGTSKHMNESSITKVRTRKWKSEYMSVY